MRLRSSANAIDPGRLAPAPASPASRPASAAASQGMAALLDSEQIARVADHARRSSLTFDEAAVDLGLLTRDQLETAKQAPALPISNDSRLSPLLVAARDLNDPYVVNVRAIRSRILSEQPDTGDRRPRSCALIGFDCAEELAVLAANLAIVMVGMGAPALLVETDPAHRELRALFGVAADGGEAALPTPIPQLWILPAVHRSDAHPQERQPIVDRYRRWHAPQSQVIAALALNRSTGAETTAAAVMGIDTVVIAVRRHVSRIAAVRGLIDSLDQAGVSIAGTVLV